MWSLIFTLLSLYSVRNGFVSAACDVYLPQLQYTSKNTCPGCHLSGFGVNVWHGNNAMNMGDGNSYQEFLVIHPVDDSTGTGYVEYALNGQYDSFSGVIGQANPSNGCEDSTTFGFRFKIYVDDTQRFESNVITNKAQFQYTGDIDVSGADKLRIETINLGENTCDHATIAEPKLVSTTHCCCTSNVDTARYFSKCQRFKNQENKCLARVDDDTGDNECSFMFCGFVDGLCRLDKTIVGPPKGAKKTCRAITNLADCEAYEENNVAFCNWRIGVPPLQIKWDQEEEMEEMEMFIDGKNKYMMTYQTNNTVLIMVAMIIAILIGFGVYKYWKHCQGGYKSVTSTSENNPLLINMQ